MLAYLDTVIGFAVVMLGVSLLITTLTQMVSALLNHRGVNLAWGLKKVFENIDPKLTTLKDEADWLSREVLTHCLISDSWFSGWPVFKRIHLASAIRPVELSAILAHIAAAQAASPDERKKKLAAEIQTLLAAENPALERDIDLVTKAVGSNTMIAGLLATTAEPVVSEAVTMAQKAAGQLEGWFESMMDRVSQRFTMTMRVWTILFSAAFALATGLNSIQLLRDLYVNGDFRAQLVNASKPVSDAAQKIVGDARTNDEAVQRALEASYSSALKTALEKAGVKGVEAPASGVASLAQARRWIDVHVTAQADHDRAMAELGPASEQATEQLLKSDAQAAADVRTIFSKAGYEVVAFHYPPGFKQLDTGARAAYLGGVLVTVMLLSLGAPFWFNALKSLTNLRPVLAQQTEKKQP